MVVVRVRYIYNIRFDFRRNFYSWMNEFKQSFDHSKYDAWISMYFCHRLTWLFMPVRQNSKKIYATKSLSAVSSSFERYILRHKVSRGLKNGSQSGRGQKNMVDMAKSQSVSFCSIILLICSRAFSWNKIINKYKSKRIISIFMYMVRVIKPSKFWYKK